MFFVYSQVSGNQLESNASLVITHIQHSISPVFILFKLTNEENL